MDSQQNLAIVRGGRIANRSPGGRSSYAGVKGLMRYIAYGPYRFGEETQQARGVWLDQAGREKSHEAVLQWAKDKVHRYDYEFSYQLLLSTRYGGLTAADFNRALERGSAVSQTQEWRFMVHQDTGNQHAHVILFRKEKLSSALYKEWQQLMQAELEALQAGRWQERQLQAGLEQLPAGRRPEQAIQTGQELQAEPDQAEERGRQQQRGWGVEL
ncbi:MAG: hypothetical protein L0322_14300 [Chloroflexi bacterium]|nr:hypothetical protein [Chloroflexota bacterium]